MDYNQTVETNLSLNGEKLIQGFEGFCLSFYADTVGYPTVGYGHLITRRRTFRRNTTGDPNDSKLTKAEAAALVKDFKLSYSSPISIDKAESLFLKDVKTAVAAVNAYNKIPSGCVLSQYQFDALVSIVYNGGPGVLDTHDMEAMLTNRKIYAWNLTSSECDACSKLVSKAFSYDRSLKSRRNKEAEYFCQTKPYTHKYKVYTL